MIPDVTSKENEKILGDKPAALHITQVSALQYTWQVLGGDHILHKQNSEKECQRRERISVLWSNMPVKTKTTQLWYQCMKLKISISDRQSLHDHNAL